MGINQPMAINIKQPMAINRYAVLVDAENTQHSRMDFVMEELAKFGATSIRLVYGDFTKPTLSPWRTVALNLSFRSVNAFSFTAGKGSSDAAMIIDAMDILHTNEAVRPATRTHTLTRDATQLRASQPCRHLCTQRGRVSISCHRSTASVS